MPYAGRKALVKVAGTPVTMTAEATTLLSGGGITVNTQYQITATTKQIIDINSAITVLVSAVPVTTGFTIDTLRGVIIFDAGAVRTVTVTGKYVPTATAAEAKEWSLTVNADLIDVTKFQSDWLTKIQGLKSAEGSISQWWSIDTYFATALLSGVPVVVELYAQDTLSPDRMWAVLTSDEVAAAVDGAVEESVSFESTNKMLMNYA